MLDFDLMTESPKFHDDWVYIFAYDKKHHRIQRITTNELSDAWRDIRHNKDCLRYTSEIIYNEEDFWRKIEAHKALYEKESANDPELKKRGYVLEKNEHVKTSWENPYIKGISIAIGAIMMFTPFLLIVLPILFAVFRIK